VSIAIRSETRTGQSESRSSIDKATTWDSGETWFNVTTAETTSTRAPSGLTVRDGAAWHMRTIDPEGGARADLIHRHSASTSSYLVPFPGRSVILARRAKRGVDPFARLPIAVLQSAAWRTLNHSARSTLTVLAAQFHGRLPDGTFVNGLSVLTRKVCARYGIVHDTAVRDAAELERRGLIVRTYRAKYRSSPPQRRLASEWALGWLPITHRNHDLRDRPQAAPNAWERWAQISDADVASATSPPTALASAVVPSDCRLGVVDQPTTADDSPLHLRSGSGAA
jgi:hypothetical protein